MYSISHNAASFFFTCRNFRWDFRKNDWKLIHALSCVSKSIQYCFFPLHCYTCMSVYLISVFVANNLQSIIVE